MVYNPEDLASLEVTLLGVLCVGLPPARSAGSDTFRIDHVAAVVDGLLTEGRKEANLGPDGVHVTPEFAQRLRATIESLLEKELVIRQTPGMPAPVGGLEEGLLLDLVDPEDRPAVVDHYLAEQCMESRFKVPEVYPFLMERYSSSGEVWRRLREAGYAS